MQPQTSWATPGLFTRVSQMLIWVSVEKEVGNTVGIMVQFPLTSVAQLIQLQRFLVFIGLEDTLQARLGTRWHLLEWWPGRMHLPSPPPVTCHHHPHHPCFFPWDIQADHGQPPQQLYIPQSPQILSVLLYLKEIKILYTLELQKLKRKQKSSNISIFILARDTSHLIHSVGWQIKWNTQNIYIICQIDYIILKGIAWEYISVGSASTDSTKLGWIAGKGGNKTAQCMFLWQRASLDIQKRGFNIWCHEIHNVSTLNM